MENKDRLSAGMTAENAAKAYAILKERFERRRKKLRDLEEMNRRAVDRNEARED